MSEIRVKSTGTIKLFESDNTSHVTIASPASLSANRTITIPDADVTLGAGVSLTGSTNNQVTTVTGANAITGETNFIYNGTIVGAGADGANADLGTGVHIKSGDSGQGSVEAEANLLILESASGGGLSIYTGNSHEAKINFGDSGNDNQGQIMYHHNGDSMRFNTNNDERMRIDSAGKVGIGETTPLGKLHVKTADSGASVLSGADQLVLESNADCGLSILSDTNDYGQVVFGDSGDNDIGKIRYNHGNNSMDVYVNGAEAMRIDQYRNVGIGTTSVNAKFEVVTNIDGVVARFVNDGDDANRDGIYVQGGHDNGSGTTTYFLAADGDGTSTGGLETSSGTFQLFNTSDKRLKQNIVDTSINGINSIKNLKVRDFAYKKNPTETIVGGFIAQELKEVFPQAVSEGRTEEKILSVSRERLVPFLTKALQEAITKIETLETANTNKNTKITALETSVADLTTRLEALENA